MSKIIYCAFDDCDLADLAMGNLRRAGFGIESIETLGPIRRHTQDVLPTPFLLPGLEGNILLPTALSDDEGSAVIPGSEPADIRIVCSDRDCRAIVSRLINFGAHKIRYR